MVATTIPLTPDALTPEWLTGALHSTGQIGDATVTSVETQPVGQGVGILCQLARVMLRYDDTTAAAQRPQPGAPKEPPRTLIAKLPTGDEQTRGMVRLFRFYEREVRFYDEVADRVEMRTPRTYFSAFDSASGDFILLLEDLAAARLGDQLASCSMADAELAMSELAKLHAAWWESPRLAELDWMPVVNDPVNKAGLALYPHAWPVFMERFGSALPERILTAGQQLGARAGEILDRLASGPRTVCHGDFRLDNLFFGDLGGQAPLAVIDWQIASRATGTYDVGYFMSQSLDTEVRRAHEMEILKRYHGMLTERGVQGYSFDQCLNDYRWTLLFCFVYPVMAGGLGDLSNERGHALARAMTERSATAILDWKADELLAG